MASTAGRPVLVRALSLWSGLAILVAILFGPSGLRAVDVVRWMSISTSARALLWGAWTALTTPVVAAAFDAPGTITLRTLMSRRALVTHVLFLLTVAQLPWAVLFACGIGPLAAANAAPLAVALETSALAASRRPRHALLAAVAAAVVVADLPSGLTVAPAVALAYVSTMAAWRGRLVARSSTLRLTGRTSPVLALTVTHLLGLVRTARARVTTAATMAFLGGAALFLSLRNDPPARPVARALLCLTLPLCVAISVLVAPALRVEERLAPYTRATRTPSRVVFLSLALTLATPSSAFGATSSAVAVSLAGGAPWTTAAAVLAWACALALTLAGWARRHHRTARRDPGLFVVGVLAVAAAFSGIASW